MRVAAKTIASGKHNSQDLACGVEFALELRQGTRSIGEIAVAIRFRSSSAFSTAFSQAVDAGRLDDLDRMYWEIKEKKGKLDVLFANAGIYEQMPYDKVTEDFYDNCVDINAKGVFFTIQKAIPLMDSSGSIILNGSFIGSTGFPGMAVYGATKAAVRSFARTFTAELKGIGPRINVISPGPIDTAGNASTLGSIKEIREYVTNMVPRGRIGKGDDIGRTAVFLASDDSSFVAGVELFVDGGVNAI
jgi:NAD(P)-dependent dehydrogenase (short-subunit alcohol dehydrogenase family)